MLINRRTKLTAFLIIAVLTITTLCVSIYYDQKQPPILPDSLPSEEEAQEQEPPEEQEEPEEEPFEAEIPRAEKPEPLPEPPTKEEPTVPTPAPPTPPAPPEQVPAPPKPTPPPVTPPAPVPAAKGSLMVGYYTGWSSQNGFLPEKLDASKLTHINYAFANISSDLKLVMAHPAQDKQNFEGLRRLKQKNPALKLLISVGGWDYSKNFSDVALTAQSRETFAQSCVDFVLTHGLDGVDLDWEFPVSGGVAGNINRPSDKQNFTKLLTAIRNAFNAQSAKDGKQYLLTIAGANSSSYLNKIELSAVLPLVDYIFIMGYDMHGPWDGYADFNAPLYSPSEKSPQYKLSVNDAVSAYLGAGAPAKKLVLGMPFYGYRYTVDSSANKGLYSPFSNAKSIGYDTVLSGYLGKAAYTNAVHPAAQVPYIYGQNTFITYEDATSIAAKVQLAKDYGLAGVGAWELAHDKGGTLLTAAHNALRQ